MERPKNAPKWAQRNVKPQTPVRKRKLTYDSVASLAAKDGAVDLGEVFGSVKPGYDGDTGSDIDVGRSNTGVRRAKIEKTKMHLQMCAVQTLELAAKAMKRSSDNKDEALQAIATNKDKSFVEDGPIQ